MKSNNPFDRKIELNQSKLVFHRDAAIELTDTLDLCWAAAQSIFGKKALPEHALTLLPLFMARGDAKLQQELAQHRANMAAASAQHAASKRRKAPPKAS